MIKKQKAYRIDNLPNEFTELDIKEMFKSINSEIEQTVFG